MFWALSGTASEASTTSVARKLVCFERAVIYESDSPEVCGAARGIVGGGVECSVNARTGTHVSAECSEIGHRSSAVEEGVRKGGTRYGGEACNLTRGIKALSNTTGPAE